MVNSVNKIYGLNWKLRVESWECVLLDYAPIINWKLRVENWECVELNFVPFAPQRCHPEAKVTSIFIHQSLSAWRVAPELVENWELKVENRFILTSRPYPEAKATSIVENQFLSASWVARPRTLRSLLIANWKLRIRSLTPKQVLMINEDPQQNLMQKVVVTRWH